MRDEAATPRVVDRILAVRPEDLRPALWAALLHFCLLASYYILRPLREEVGSHHNEVLDLLWTATAVVSLAMVPLYSWAASRWPRRIFLARAVRAVAATVAAFYLAFVLLPESTAAAFEMAFYVWVSVLNLLTVTLFWGFLADTFRPAQGRRVFGLAALGGSLGGIAGPALTSLLAAPLGRANLLLLAVALLEAAVLCLRAVERNAPARDDQDAAAAAAAARPLPGGPWAGIAAVFRSGYLLGISAYLLVFTFGSGLLYFFVAELARDAFPDRSLRAAFFGRVDLGVNLGTLLLQLFLTGRVIQRIGLGWTLALVPLLTVAGFSALVFLPALGLIVAFQIARRTANFALSRPGREVLFTVLPRDQKYKAKAFVDTFVYRFGDVATGWLHTAMVAAGLGLAGMAFVAQGVAWGGAALALRLGHRQRRLEDEGGS